MKVDYQLQYSDYRQFEIYIQNRDNGISARAALLRNLGIVTIFAALGAFVPSSQPGNSPNLLSKIVGILFAVLFVGSIWFILFRLASARAKKEFAEDLTLSNPQTIRLDAHGIFHQDAIGESTTHWSSLRGVVNGKDVIYLLTSKKTAFLIPQRAFGTLAEYQQFYEEAFKRWQQSNDIGIKESA